MDGNYWLAPQPNGPDSPDADHAAEPHRTSDWAAICHADGRAFGFALHAGADRAIARSIHDVSRFELAFDGKEIVAIVGVFSLQVTLPGGGQLPMGGLTWVSTATTHRRQGLLTQLMARSLADIDRRGEPVAMLVRQRGWDLRAVRVRCGHAGSCDDRSIAGLAQLRPEFQPTRGAVRFVDGDEALEHVMRVWSRFHRLRSGEVDRGEAWHRFLFDHGAEPMGGFSPSFYLAHRDGYAVYRIEPQWNDGRPAHNMRMSRARREHRRCARRAVAHVARRRPGRPIISSRDVRSTIRCRTC